MAFQITDSHCTHPSQVHPSWNLTDAQVAVMERVTRVPGFSHFLLEGLRSPKSDVFLDEEGQGPIVLRYATTSGSQGLQVGAVRVDQDGKIDYDRLTSGEGDDVVNSGVVSSIK